MSIRFKFSCLALNSVLLGFSFFSLEVFTQSQLVEASEFEDFKQICLEQLNANLSASEDSSETELTEEIEIPNLEEYCQQIFENNFEGENETEIRQGNSIQNLLLEFFPTKTLTYYQRQFQQAKEQGDQVKQARSLYLIGRIYQFQGQYSQALIFYEQGLAIAQSVNNPVITGVTLHSIGELYLNRRQADQAFSIYQQLAEVTEKNSKLFQEIFWIRPFYSMAVSYEIKGDLDQAIKFYEKDLNSSFSSSLFDPRIQTLEELGRLYLQKNQPEKALELYQQLLQIAENSKDDNKQWLILNAISHLGRFYESQEQYEQAITYYNQALAMVKSKRLEAQLPEILTDLGRVYNKNGQYAEAEKFLLDALKAEESEAFLQEEELKKEAQELKREQEKLKAQGVSDDEEFPPDLELFNLNYEMILDSGNNFFYEISRNTYQELQRTLVALNKPGLALEVAEKSRARAFFELIADTLNGSSNLNWEELTLLSDLANFNLEEMQQIAKQENATIVYYSVLMAPILDGLDYASEVSGSGISQEEALLIWVIQPTGNIVFRQVELTGNPTSLKTLVLNGRNAIFRTATANTSVPNLQQLHQLLIAPIADQLPSNPEAHVIVVPDGSLFLVPFATLQDEAGQYLIEKHTLRTIPALRVLQLVEQRTVTGQGALVVGNPEMPSYSYKLGETPQPLDPLPGSELEAQEIAALLQTSPILGSGATKSTVLKQISPARIVHLATHGLLDSYEGLGSAIALAPTPEDNGLLTAQEILELKLNAELVVLSACNTGRGRLTGDGVIGLSRSILAAGANSLLVSLWAVPDAPTARLMTEFYQNWQKNPDKAQALRQAMLTIKQQDPAPVNWAGFTLIGKD